MIAAETMGYKTIKNIKSDNNKLQELEHDSTDSEVDKE